MARLTPEGQLLHDVTVRFQVYLERLKAGQVRGLDKAIREMDLAVRRALAGANDVPSQRQVALLLAQLRKKMTTIVERNTATYMGTLRNFSDYAAEFHLRTIELVLPPATPGLLAVSSAAAWSGTLASPIQATGALLEPFVDNWGRAAMDKVEGAIRTGFAQGQTVQQIMQAIRGTKARNFRDGILGGVVKRDANAMVRTSLQHINNSAQQMVYEDNADIIEGYIWISTLDSRTTSTCRSLDGQQFKLGKGPVPPIHINCRSSTIPKVAGVDLLSEVTRASKGAEGGKQVAASQTYYSWLKTQPAWFQDDALGPSRAALFRKGGLSADEFARLNLDKNFQPLTLEEMRKKNPAAFRKAGI